MLGLLTWGIQAADEKKPAAPAKSAPKPATGNKGGTGTTPATGRGATGTSATPAGRGATPGATGGARGATNAPGARGATNTPGARGANPAGGGARAGAGGRPEPRGATTVRGRSGAEVTRRADGRPATVHTANGMDIHHGLNGHESVVRERADHSRVVAYRGERGYVQHPYAFRGHEFAARTYYVHGRPYERFYRGYPYHGVYLEVYAPVRYYPVAFYGWAYNPWITPVPYAWGWAANPWFGFYGWYFNPFPTYAAAPFWLTDYLISNSLAAAYQAQLDAQMIAANQTAVAQQAALDAQTKQLIADEVKRQIALENAEAQGNLQSNDPDPASSGIARMLADGASHVFIVGDDLDLLDASTQQECAVTMGDVLQLSAPPPPTSPSANLVVLASKGGIECRKASIVLVQLPDLQNMQNHMRESLDEGMTDLQAHKNGLPAPPQSALAMATPAVFSMGAPPPDPTVAQQIKQQYQDGTQAEQQAISDTSAAPAGAAPSASVAPIAAPAAPPATVSLGQTTDQVTSILGQPKTILDLGAKKIYVYQDLKVTFNDGKVTDIE